MRLTRRSCAIGLVAIALLLVFATAAQAAPPTCNAVPPQTIPFANPLFLSGADYCVDTDGDQLTYAVVALPANGNLDASPDGFFTYVPASGFSGEDSFAFTAKDATATTDPVTVSITVAADRAPVCPTNMSFDAEPGQPTYFDPQFGFQQQACLDLDFQPLTVVVIDQPTHGSLAASDPFAGALTYTPDAGYSGPDVFTFKASDGTLDSALVHVAITVLKPKQAPHCVTPLTVRTAPNTPVALNGAGIPCTDPDGDQLVPNLISGPSHGDLTVLNGDVIYMPARGFVGTDSIGYRVVDTRGASSNDATIYIVVGSTPAATLTPAASASPPPEPAADTAPPSVRIHVRRQRLRALGRHGLQIVLSPSERCTLRAAVFVDRRTAGKLKLVRRPTRAVRVGAATHSAGAEQVVLTIRLKSNLRSALRSLQNIRLRIRVTAIDAAGNAATRALTVVVHR